jgi:hypothetical protein
MYSEDLFQKMWKKFIQILPQNTETPHQAIKIELASKVTIWIVVAGISFAYVNLAKQTF